MDNLESQEWATSWQHRCGQDTQKRAQRQHGTRMAEWRHQPPCSRQIPDPRYHTSPVVADITRMLVSLAGTDQTCPVSICNSTRWRHSYKCWYSSKWNNTRHMNTTEKLQSPLLSCIINHHHHHYAAGIGRQTAFITSLTTRQQVQAVKLPTFTQPHCHPLSFRNIAIRTAGSGRKPVTLTRQSAIWHCSRETISLMKMTTYPQAPQHYIFFVWPAHTIYSWRFGITEGSLKAPNANRRSPQSSLKDINQWVSSSSSIFSLWNWKIEFEVLSPFPHSLWYSSHSSCLMTKGTDPMPLVSLTVWLMSQK
jgi:hypothetical protein